MLSAESNELALRASAIFEQGSSAAVRAVDPAFYPSSSEISRGVGRSWRLPRSASRPYLTALFFVTAAAVSTMLIRGLFPYPFLILFFAAVMASAWVGGTGACLFAVLVSTLAVCYFFVPPFYSFAINATDTSYFASFIVCAFVASWGSSSKKKSEEALRDARDLLEMRVAQRTRELQKTNSELREREHQLRLLTEVIPQQIWSGTPDGSIDYCNERLLDYVGRTLNQLRGEWFVETIHPDDRSSFSQAWRQALSTGEPFEGQWRVRGAGGQYRHFFTPRVPPRNGSDKPVRWYGTNTDIEDHKCAEQTLTKTQAELAHLSRVLTMGELTSSIAHEMNQPLAAVVTYGHACLEWLSLDPPDLEEAKVAAERIVQDGTRAGAVLSRIRMLFKNEAPLRDWLDMNGVIQELFVFLRREAEAHDISLQTDLDPHLPTVVGDRVQLQQVVLNLILNGIDAVRETPGSKKEVVIRSCRENSSGVRIQVEDSGPGLSPEITDKIFNPFFTTKRQGIGMGLSTTPSMVEPPAG